MLIEPEDEGDEHFIDAPEEGQAAAGSSKTALKPDQRAYDGKKREPQYAHADSSCLWELVSLSYLSRREHEAHPRRCLS